MSNTSYTLLDVAKHVAFESGELLDDIDSVEGGAVADPSIRELLRAINATLRTINQYRGLRLKNARATFNTLDEYTTGDVDVTQGSTDVTGNSTSFTSALVGRVFHVPSQSGLYRIQSVDATADTLVLDRKFVGDDASGTTYEIVQDRYEAASNVKAIKGARIGGDANYPLEIVDLEEIENDRAHERFAPVSPGAPEKISLDYERSSSNNFWYVVDPFPDDIYQVRLTVELQLTTLKLDSDIIPIEDEEIDVLLDGAHAKFISIMGESPQDRQAFEVWIATTLDRHLVTSQKKTDTRFQLVPDDVTRTRSRIGTGRIDWKNR